MTEIRTQRLLTKKYQEDAKFDDNKANGFLRKRIEPQNEFIDQMMEKYEAGNATTGLEKAESEDKPIKYARGTDEGGADREGVVTRKRSESRICAKGLGDDFFLESASGRKANRKRATFCRDKRPLLSNPIDCTCTWA